MSNNAELINMIASRDRALGKLCVEAQHSYNEENYYSALVCLFSVAEQIVKFAIDKTEGNFSKSIAKAYEKNLISRDEEELLNSIREIRNKLFHENHYCTGIEVDGKFWSFSENDTQQLIYEMYSTKLFQLAIKLQ